MRNSIFLGLMMMLISYHTESEKILEKEIMNEHSDFSSIEAKHKTIDYNIANGVQYGIITFQWYLC